MANMNSATPNSREQSIMNESIDFTEVGAESCLSGLILLFIM